MSIRDVFDEAAQEVAHALGEPATYNGTPDVPVVWGAAFQAVQSGEIRVASKRPDVYVRHGDLPEVSPGTRMYPAKGDSLVIRGVGYTVATERPDLEGVGSYLTLKADPVA